MHQACLLSLLRHCYRFHVYLVYVQCLSPASLRDPSLYKVDADHAIGAQHESMPFRLLSRSAVADKSFANLSKMKALVLLPYDMDLVAFYEFYSMRVPLFMPGTIEKYVFFQNHKSYDGQFFRLRGNTSLSAWEELQGKDHKIRLETSSNAIQLNGFIVL